MNKELDNFFSKQLSSWPQAAASFRALKSAQTRTLNIGGLEVVLQHNPGRIKSSTANIDPDYLKKRACFLCEKNRPAEQMHFTFEGRKDRMYQVTVNPYPVFPGHIVISAANHTPQSMWHRFSDMTDMVRTWDGYTVMYNGPFSGASAPDHMHFQGFPQGNLPIEKEVNRLFDASDEKDLRFLASIQEAKLYQYNKYCRGVFVLRGETQKSLAKLFYRLLDCSPVNEGENETRFNAILWHTGAEFRCVVILRDKHQSSHYFTDGPDHLTMSLGCVDVMGYYIVPEEDDYKKLDTRLITEMLNEDTMTQEKIDGVVNRLTRTQPTIRVGIMNGKEIEFEIISDGAGPQKVTYQEGKINYNGALYDELEFGANNSSTMFAEPTFILYGVTIGVDFHWQRKVTQKFAGSLKFIVEDNKITAVNIIGVEDYLLSVISSEMKSSATLEFLKAHSVISRSWVMSQIKDKSAPAPKGPEINNVPELTTYVNAGNVAAAAAKTAGNPGEYVKWFGHSDHKNFDVCADDHCQRYQGLTMAAGENVRIAIDQTWGQVMMSEGEIVDARFSKSCGGMMEKFSACWDDKDYPYLIGITDTAEESTKPDLTKEDEAKKWILSSPKSFCNTTDNSILSQVLNDYDLETKAFYRWDISYGRKELTELFERRSENMFGLGPIVYLKPVERSVSARLVRLEVCGENGSKVIGKELIIRRFLSESHLYSSAFVVKYYDKAGNEIPEEKVISDWENEKKVEWEKLTLFGAGWGHGVGLCQIGAAVMSYSGYTYEQILQHYYPTSTLERRSDL
ncbi:MAG: DUF4922 domain-containing protein [Bacteroidales bacterium]|nr:DUF4922 domain-containing protein [Bacteroidales bacterium]